MIGLPTEAGLQDQDQEEEERYLTNCFENFNQKHFLLLKQIYIIETTQKIKQSKCNYIEKTFSSDCLHKYLKLR